MQEHKDEQETPARRLPLPSWELDNLLHYCMYMKSLISASGTNSLLGQEEILNLTLEQAT